MYVSYSQACQFCLDMIEQFFILVSINKKQFGTFIIIINYENVAAGLQNITLDNICSTSFPLYSAIIYTLSFFITF